MNRDEFKKKVKELSSTTKMNVRRLPDWVEESLKVLDALSKQKAGVQHPGHRGSSREDLLKEILDDMLPRPMKVIKGFAVNQHTITSLEQDLMVVDRSIAGPILPGDKMHYPVESCLASVQVKSNLNRETIRDAALNCISIKQTLSMSPDEAERKSSCNKLCYAVFSYRCEYELERMAEVVNQELEPVERHFWPNLFFLLGKGMLIPADNRRIQLENETMFTGSQFRTVGNMGVEPALKESQAYPFLWFLTNIIDHCIQQRSERQSPSYKGYWLTAFGLQSAVKKHMDTGSLS